MKRTCSIFNILGKRLRDKKQRKFPFQLLLVVTFLVIVLSALSLTGKTYASILFSEDFGGTNQHLESYDSSWTNISSYYITDNSNVGANSETAGGHEAVYYGPSVSSADIKYKISYKVDTSVANNVLYFMIKSNTSLNTGYGIRYAYDSGQDHMWIQNRSSGSFIRQYNNTVSRSNGDWVDLEADYNSGTFTLKINGSTVDTYADGTYQATTGRIGLLCLGCSVKNLQIEDYVVPTATPTPVPGADGWQTGDTWSYASSTSVTVPSDATLKYSPGDKIRLKQGGSYKYFYVTGVTSTTLTVTGGSDYSVANSSITDNDYSKVVSPVGFPQWFNFSPGFSGGGSMSVSNVQNVTGKFAINGRDVHVLFAATVDTSGTASYGINVSSLPVNPNTGSSSIIGAAHIDDGTGGTMAEIFADSTELKMINDSNIALTSGIHIGSNFTYSY